MGANHEKNEGRKSRDTLPLKVNNNQIINAFHFQIAVRSVRSLSVV